MLTREQAQEQLLKIHDADDVERLFAAAKKLSGPVREAAFTLLGLDAAGNREARCDPGWAKARARAAAALDKASRKDRAKLLQTLLGEIAPGAELAWNCLPRLVYQQGGCRRPFRVKNRPELFRWRRFDWLERLIQTVGPYQQAGVVSLPWLAAWAPYLGYAVDDILGILFAAVIDAGGKDADEVYDILTASAKNEHDIGSMGRHVTRALLTCSKPEASDFVEKLLLAAQRQEGLRQVVLETVDEAQPEAFRRMLRLIIENDLIRFSAVARAVNVWFGFQWDSISTGAFNKILNQIAGLLDSEAARGQALAGDDPEAVYHALWAIAYDDAAVALEQAQPILRDKSPEKRFAAVTLVSHLHLPEGRRALLEMMADDDLRVALAAHRACMEGAWERNEDGTLGKRDDQFERLEALLRRVPDRKKVTLEAILWPWTALPLNRTALAVDLVRLGEDRPIGRVLSYLDDLDPLGRAAVAARLASLKAWDAAARRAALAMAGDASAQVRETVLGALQRTRIAKGEAVLLESYLIRKAADLRRGVVTLLLSQADTAVLASADRLLQAGPAQQRLAGLELLRQLAEKDRQADACRERARAYLAQRRQLGKDEQTQLDAILAEKQETLTLDNALGLMNPAERSPVVPPRRRPARLVTPAAIACLRALDALAEAHKNAPVHLETYQGGRQELLGNCQWGLPWPDASLPREEQLAKFPLAEVVEAWYRDRRKDLRDTDGLELVRAAFWVYLSGQHYQYQEWKEWQKRSPRIKEALQLLSGGQDFAKLNYPAVVQSWLDWLRFAHPEPGLTGFLLDANEALLARLPADHYLLTDEALAAAQQTDKEPDPDWRDAWMFAKWLDALRAPGFAEALLLPQGLAVFAHWSVTVQPEPRADGLGGTVEPTAGGASPDQLKRCWNLLHWFDEPIPRAVRHRPPLWILLQAFQNGFASEADVLDDLLGPRGSESVGYYAPRFDSLHALTARKPDPLITDNPVLRALADRCRTRLLEIELARGETETAASRPATQLGALFGSDTLVRLLQGLGKTGFQRPDFWRRSGFSKPAVLSALVRVTFPTEADTRADFTRRMRAAVEAGQFPEDRLIELAFQAPQWGRHVADYYGWPGFQEGLWWFLAHMSAFVGDLGDTDVGAESVPEESRPGEPPRELSPWEKLIRQRTPLSDGERYGGAVDMAWFRRVYDELGDKRWRRMGEAARWGATTARAHKALHLGDVILGKANLRELIAAVETKRLKEAVRLLGIYPLPAGAKRDKALEERYRVLVEYRRYAKQLGPQSKPGALQAAQVGLENLARTAGFPDPLRLEWAQEARSLADLAAGPVEVSQQGVTVALFLDEQRQPQIAYEKAGKPLKSLPAALKKNEKFAALLERRTELRRQSARIKESLENAMCRGDPFTAQELRALAAHPLLAPLLERLVLVGDGILGYPAQGGRALRDFAGKLEPVKRDETLHIAHPHDLLASGRWHDWQHECFQAERVQPFKQVFRELYVVTAQEKKDGAISLRFNGQQVNPQQATALFSARNWNTIEGIWKTFYDVRITATVWCKFGWGTPLEVEGWTLEGVEFRLQDELRPMPLDRVPPRVFSEVMRDLDLVVSVAHRGGVDPEASASTVEMRANLLRETCALLNIDNYKIQDAHVLVDGKLGDYSIHLGSAVVHRRPGGALCILPVHAQHRGRLFLPFADDDPKTAEVLSKVLLLARDDEIQDPTILEQLR
jgi:hypothetical protein